MTGETMSEKTPLQSKKFVAYLLAEITWKILLGLMLVTFRDEITGVGVWAWWTMLSIVIVAGFVEVGFIGGQAWLDKYVRVAEIASKGAASITPDESSEES
jgi:hypothetical protein